jgi:hypothetical protein
MYQRCLPVYLTFKEKYKLYKHEKSENPHFISVRSANIFLDFEFDSILPETWKIYPVIKKILNRTNFVFKTL